MRQPGPRWSAIGKKVSGLGAKVRSAGASWRSRISARRVTSPALLLVGAILLTYVGTQYGRMYFEQRELARQWEAQQQAAPVVHASAKVNDDGLTRLSIPKIELNSIVVEGTSDRALLLGPAHMPESVQPGETGNAVITGHRDTFFRHIHELEVGDTMLVQRDGHTYRYEVTGKKVVDPTDISVLRPAKDGQLTLITCYPTYYIGPAPKRLVVFSKLVDGEHATVAGRGGSD